MKKIISILLLVISLIICGAIGFWKLNSNMVANNNIDYANSNFELPNSKMYSQEINELDIKNEENVLALAKHLYGKVKEVYTLNQSDYIDYKQKSGDYWEIDVNINKMRNIMSEGAVTEFFDKNGIIKKDNAYYAPSISSETGFFDFATESFEVVNITDDKIDFCINEKCYEIIPEGDNVERSNLSMKNDFSIVKEKNGWKVDKFIFPICVSDEECTKISVQNYLNLVAAEYGDPKYMIDELGLQLSIDYDNHDIKYFLKTNIKYEEFRQKMLKYVSEDWFESRFSDLVEPDETNYDLGSMYKNVNGILYVADVGSSGRAYKLKNISYKNAESYIIEYDIIFEEMVLATNTAKVEIEPETYLITYCEL